MKKIKSNINFATDILVSGLIFLFISFLLMPGNVKNSADISFVPLLFFISGAVITLWGIMKIFIAILKK